MKMQSIVNRLMKNYRPEQERKLKRPVHRLWQRRQPPEEPSRRRLPKLSEQSLQLFNQQSVRVAVFTIHLRLQWQRAQCVRRAAKSVGNLYAGFWEEFSAAARGDGSCSDGPVGRLRTSHSDLVKKIAGRFTRPAILIGRALFLR